MDWKDIGKDNNNVACYEVDGWLNAAKTLYVKDDVLSSMPPDKDVVVDCTKMGHIDSSGLGMLVQMLQKARSHGHTVVLAGVKPNAKIVFDITKVSKVFYMASDVNDALQFLSKSNEQHASNLV